jgi:hypothetical protein
MQPIADLANRSITQDEEAPAAQIVPVMNKWLASKILPAKLVTGKLKDFTIEAAGADEMPDYAVQRMEQTLLSRTSLEEITEHRMYYRLLATLRLGTTEQAAGVNICVSPRAAASAAPQFSLYAHSMRSAELQKFYKEKVMQRQKDLFGARPAPSINTLSNSLFT